MQKLNLLFIFESTDVDQSLGAGVGEGVAQATQVGVQRVQIILEAHVVAGGKSGVGESLTRSPIGCIGNSFGRPSQIRVTYKFTGKKKLAENLSNDAILMVLSNNIFLFSRTGSGQTVGGRSNLTQRRRHLTQNSKHR